MTLKRTYFFMIVLAGCSTGEHHESIGTSVQGASGGTRPGTTPGPTCEAPRCYRSTVSQYAIKAVSYGLKHAVDAYSANGAGGKFISEGYDAIAAVTSDNRNTAIAVKARTTATTGGGPAVRARASGASGVPLRLANHGGGSLFVARAGPDVLRIHENGDLYRNGVLLGKRGLPGEDGEDGDRGADGSPGKPGKDGLSNLEFHCGRYDECRDACRGKVVGEAIGTCEVALLGGGCSWGGTDGRCCACASR